MITSAHTSMIRVDPRILGPKNAAWPRWLKLIEKQKQAHVAAGHRVTVTRTGWTCHTCAVPAARVPPPRRKGKTR